MNRPFDEAKYNALLKGLEIVEVKLSDVKSGLRMDAEMYQKHFVLTEKLLGRKNSEILNDLSDTIKKGIFDINANCYTDEGVPFVRITNLRNMVIEDNNIVFIPESEHKKNIETALKRNDIILSKTAYPAASLVTLTECNTSQDTVAIRLKGNSRIKSHYLVAFLNTKYGLTQMRRWFTGNIQMHLNLTDCKEMIIPFQSLLFQTKIQELFENSIRVQGESKILYKQAENLLLEAVGLKDFEPSKEKTNVKTLKESFLATGRLDAEFYQPKYEELKTIIKNNAVSFCQIESIATFNQRGEQPRYVDNGKLKIINSRHILEQHLDYDNFELTGADEWDISPLARVFKNDILIYTTGANVGRTNVYLIEDRALASNHVNILRVKNANPVYVGFVLSSLIGRMQTEQIVTGSAQAELYPSAIEQFIVPFVSKEIEEKIVSNVQESLLRQQQSKNLLETAKRAVEIAIEETEEKAIEFIKNKIG